MGCCVEVGLGLHFPRKWLCGLERDLRRANGLLILARHLQEAQCPIFVPRSGGTKFDVFDITQKDSAKTLGPRRFTRRIAFSAPGKCAVKYRPKPTVTHHPTAGGHAEEVHGAAGGPHAVPDAGRDFLPRGAGPGLRRALWTEMELNWHIWRILAMQ